MNVALVDPADAAAFAQDLDRRVPGLVARPTVRRSRQWEPFVVIERFHLAISVVTLIGSTMFLLALMVMRVEERRETAGVLRLIGVPTRRVLLNVFAEGVLIALAGVVFGVVLAVPGAGRHQPVLSMVVRHAARLRPGHSGDHLAVGGVRGAARSGCRRRVGVGAAAA